MINLKKTGLIKSLGAVALASLMAFASVISVAAGVGGVQYANAPIQMKSVEDLIGINGKPFPEIGATIIQHDPYMVLADFADYRQAQQKIETLWADRTTWNRMSLMNIAGAGKFAADRAIREYAENIWHTGPVK